MSSYTLFLSIGVIVCLAMLAFFGRLSWQFYQSTDKTNRLMLRIFVGGMGFLFLVGILGGFGLMPFSLASLGGWIAIGAIVVLVMREMWSVLHKLRLMSAFRTLEEPDEQ